MKKGFTLLEVLVALSVLSISVLGLYGLVNQSIQLTQYTKDKGMLVDKGYERMLMQINYPRLSLSNTEEINNETIEYIYVKEESIIPMVTSVRLQVKTSKAMVNYEYFESGR